MNVLKPVFGIFAVVGWVVLLGLHTFWHYTFGWLFTTLADLLDAVTIDVPHVHTFRPFGAPAAWLRSLDKNVDYALVRAANGLEHTAVWLFSRVGHFFGLLAGEIWGLARTVEHALLRFARVTIPKLIRSALRLVWREIRAQVRAIRSLGKWVTQHVYKLVKALARNALANLRDFLRFAKWARGSVLRNWKSINRVLRLLNRILNRLTGRGFNKLFAAALHSLGVPWLLANNVKRIGVAVAKLDPGDVLEWIRDELHDFDWCKLAGYQYDFSVHVVEPALARLIAAQDWYCTLPGDHLPSAVVAHPGYTGSWEPSATPPINLPLISKRLAPDVPLPRGEIV